jgi:hypothetical protein
MLEVGRHLLAATGAHVAEAHPERVIAEAG